MKCDEIRIDTNSTQKQIFKQQSDWLKIVSKTHLNIRKYLDN